jgi:hypothetical protein
VAKRFHRGTKEAAKRRNEIRHRFWRESSQVLEDSVTFLNGWAAPDIKFALSAAEGVFAQDNREERTRESFSMADRTMPGLYNEPIIPVEMTLVVV